MTIANQIGYTGFSRDFHTPPEGHVYDIEGIKAIAHRNPILPQISTVTIASFDTNTDTFTITIQLPNGTTVTACTITRSGGAPSDDTAAATAAVTAINAVAALYGHVTATSALGVITLTFDQPGISYAVASTVSGCTATVATSQAATGGTTIPYGRFVASASATAGLQPQVRVLTGSDTTLNVTGITARPQVSVNLASSDPTATDGAVPGDMVDVAYNGMVAMRNNSSSAAVKGGQVFAVVATTGGDAIGEARMDSAGVAQVITLTPGAGQNSVPVSVLITVTAGEHTGKSLLLSTTADGSMTATEVCDAWRVIINADAFWSTILIDSGTATLIITAADSSIGLDATQSNGTVTVDVATTARVPYAVPLDRNRFYWAEAVAAGGIGPVMCRA